MLKILTSEMAIEFARVAWRENNYANFNKFATAQIKQIKYREVFITPKSTKDFDKRRHCEVRLCECVEADGTPDPWTDLDKCENFEKYTCKILALGGNFFILVRI